MERTCVRCGRRHLSDSATFCPHCGSLVDGTHAPIPDGSLRMYPDGKYRWVAELSLFSHPALLLLMWRAIIELWVIAGVAVLATCVLMNEADIMMALEICMGLLPEACLGVLALMGVVAAIYGIYALAHGGKYCVIYEMDDYILVHRQLPCRIKRKEVNDALSVMADMTPIRLRQAITPLQMITECLASDFSAVRSIKGYRRHNLIKVNEPLAKNRVYVDSQAFAFIMRHVRERCPDAVVSEH